MSRPLGICLSNDDWQVRLLSHLIHLPVPEGNAFGTHRLFAALLPRRQVVSVSSAFLLAIHDLGVVSLEQACSPNRTH